MKQDGKPRDKPAFESLTVSYGGTDQQWSAAGGEALGAADRGMA